MNQSKLEPHETGPVIQCLWIGSSLSLLEQLSIRSFLQNGHPYHLYIYDDVKNVPDGVTLKNAGDILSSSQIFKYSQHDTYSAFANLFRYKLLLEKGGYWADIDVVCLKPFDFSSVYVFAGEKVSEEKKVVCNNVMKAPRDSQIMQFCYETSLSKTARELQWGETGPELLTAAVERFQLSLNVCPYRTFNPLGWWEWRELIHGGHITGIKLKWKLRRETYAIHFWNEMWRRNGVDKNDSYPSHCMYERLKQRYL